MKKILTNLYTMTIIENIKENLGRTKRRLKKITYHLDYT